MTETEFLRSIAETPDDDTSRLVLADWLDDHDQPSRAEFIRLQVELEKLDVGDSAYPEKLARSRRCGIMTGEIAQPWITQIPGARVQFRRGLIHSVQIDAGEYLKLDKRKWAEVPIQFLSLKPAEGAAAKLKKRGELANLRGLAVETWRPNELGTLLCGKTPLTNLRSLRVSPGRTQTGQPYFGKAGITFDFPKLDSLWIDGEPADWTASLEQCKNPLRRLFITGYSEFPFDDGFHDANIWDQIHNSTHWKSLEQAFVWYRLNTTSYGNSQETPGLNNYPQVMPNAKRLEFLNVSSWSVDSLVSCEDWGKLKSLMVMQKPDIDETASLLSAEQMRRTESLWLGYWGFTDHGETKIAWGENSPLQQLKRLSVMCMASDEVKALLSGPYLPNLHRLDILRYLDEQSIKHLFKAKFPQLRHLTIGGYGGVPPIDALVKSKNFPNLCTLIFGGGWGYFNHAEVEKAAHALAATKTMPHLSLVGSRERYWILRDGKAIEVPGHIAPLACDWWLHDPNDDTLCE